MTLGILSGFSVLALASGFLLKAKDKEQSVSLIEMDDIQDIDISKIDKYIPSKASYLTDSIISSPYSVLNPDFTGAVYVGDNWYLMANGDYFNKVNKTWSTKLPNQNNTKNNDDENKKVVSALPLVGSAVGTGIKIGAKTAKFLIGLGLGVLVYVIKKVNDK